MRGCSGSTQRFARHFQVVGGIVPENSENCDRKKDNVFWNPPWRQTFQIALCGN